MLQGNAAGPPLTAQGTESLTVAALRALACGVPELAMFWVQNGTLTLKYQKNTGADAELLPGTIRSDNFAACQQIFYLKAAFINGWPAEWNAETSKFHLTSASGDPIVTSGIDQTGVAFTP